MCEATATIDWATLLGRDPPVHVDGRLLERVAIGHGGTVGAHWYGGWLRLYLQLPCKGLRLLYLCLLYLL